MFLSSQPSLTRISGFFITYMGSAVGTSPGRLVETDAGGNIIHEWPEDAEGILSVLKKQFSPHGLGVDWDRNVILTSDFVVPLSILKPTTGIQRADTLRLWDLSSRKIISTITIPDVSAKYSRSNEQSNLRYRAKVFRTSNSSPVTRKALLWPRK